MLKLRQFTTTTTTIFIANKSRRFASATTSPFYAYNNGHINLSTTRRRSVSTISTSLSPSRVTEILSANEHYLDARKSSQLPKCIKSIECNQLESNNPIEDRLRVASIHLPGFKEPTLVLGVFDGHGGGTTVDIISRRLFNYIALSLHPEPNKIDLTNGLKELVVDLHQIPPKFNVDPHTQEIESQGLSIFRDDLVTQNDRSLKLGNNIVDTLKTSFQRCDDDLSQEIQEHLIRPTSLSYQMLRHYLAAAVSGCCAIVTVLHQGSAYVVSVGDCRAVLGVHGPIRTGKTIAPSEGHGNIRSSVLQALELNDEHNCDNINEIRRLAASHPKSEQNTMIKHNRLLGHLMPFRAFGDFNYKWSADMIKACGITRTFGAGVIPASYETPPYLIAEPDVNVLHLDSKDEELSSAGQDKFLIMATDGLWEMFESSRDVVETIVDHANNASQGENKEDYDTNCATYILRSALSSGPYPDISSDPERMRKLHHIRLESTLTLPKSVVRNFRDDISVILVKLQ